MQVCTSFQTDNLASTPSLSFLQAGCHSCRQTNSVKAPKARRYSHTHTQYQSSNHTQHSVILSNSRANLPPPECTGHTPPLESGDIRPHCHHAWIVHETPMCTSSNIWILGTSKALTTFRRFSHFCRAHSCN